MQRSLRTADFAGTRQEGQHIAFGLLQRLQHALCDLLAGLAAGARRQVLDRNLEQSATALDHRRIAEQARHALRLQRRRHDQHAQLRIQRRARIQRQGQRQIGRQCALMEFIEDDEANTRQFRIGLDAARQQPFGDDFDAGAGRDLALEADLVADRLADGLAKQTRHTRRRRACSDAAWFQHQDFLAREPGFGQQRQRHEGRFARAGRRREHGAADGR